MSGSFTWDAIVYVGTIKPYEKALVLTVYHELDPLSAERRTAPKPAWNTIVCFKDSLRGQIVDHLAPGDLVHFHGFVRTTSFTDDADAKRRAVDLVIQRFDLLHKHIDGPMDHQSA
ncbi:MAG: single-stranded DNA-binding protein [Roseovarius sp.]|nr:single-stranded DNA-binding protein [Roseovarius sp.]